MKLARVGSGNIAEVNAVMGDAGEIQAWAAHPDESVIIYHGNGKGHRCHDTHQKLLALCHCEKKQQEKRDDSKMSKKKKTGPKEAKKICKKEIKKCMGHGRGGYECSFSDTETWTSTHVSQEIKTRVPKKCRRHIYKSSCSCSTSSDSCTSEESSTCSSSYTTEEILRPHKRAYYHKQVEVKERVCPKGIRQEVIKKPAPPPCKPCHRPPPKQCKPCEQPRKQNCKPCQRKPYCHNGVCRMPSRSYSSDSYPGRGHRLQKRAFEEDDKDFKENVKALKGTKQEGSGKERYRAPIKFPSYSSSSSSSSSVCSSSSSSSSTSAQSSKVIREARNNLRYKVKKDKHGMPYVHVPGKRQRQVRYETNKPIQQENKKGKKTVAKSKSSTTSESSKKSSSAKNQAPMKTTPKKPAQPKKGQKPEKDKPKTSASRSHSKCESAQSKKSSPRRKKQQQPKKPAKKEIESSVSSEYVDVKVQVKKRNCKSSKRPTVDCKKPKKKSSSIEQKQKPCKKSKKTEEPPVKRSHKHRHHHHRHHHHKSSSSDNMCKKKGCGRHNCHRHQQKQPRHYKAKVDRQTEVTPISTSSDGKQPLVLQKRRYKCK